MKKLNMLVGLLFFSIGGLSGAESDFEQLLGSRVNEQGITFQVKSNGCTSKNDFHFHVQEILEQLSPMLPAYEHHHYISVNRLKQDLCEDFIPYGTEISVSFDELGINFGKYHIINPIGGDKIITYP